MNLLKKLPFFLILFFVGCANDITTVWEYTDTTEDDGIIKFIPPPINYKRKSNNFEPQNVVFETKSGMELRVTYRDEAAKLLKKFRHGEKVRVLYRKVFQVNKRGGVEFERRFFKYEFVSAKKIILYEV